MKSLEIFYKQFITYEGYKTVLQGLGTTIQIAVLGLIIGIIIGTIIAITKVIPKYSWPAKLCESFGNIYVSFFRGTPMVVQLLLGYYVILPAMGIVANSLIVAIAVFGLNSGAYISEIMRSGIQSVDVGQLEAGRAMGLSFGGSMFKIVIPQAIKNIMPTLGNEFIVLIKETSIVSFITVVDITRALSSIGDATYEYIVPYLMLAAIYLILVYLITIIVKLLEKRLKKSDRSH